MKYSLIIICLAALLSACAPPVNEIPYTAQTFPPTTEVDVLETEPAEQAYIRIAELEVNVTNYPDEALELILDKAREVGADAVIVHGVKDKGILEVPIAGSFVRQTSTARIPLRTLRATAIKYKS